MFKVDDMVSWYGHGFRILTTLHHTITNHLQNTSPYFTCLKQAEGQYYRAMGKPFDYIKARNAPNIPNATLRPLEAL